MPFEEWIVAHARISKKPHKSAKLYSSPLLSPARNPGQLGHASVASFEDRHPPSLRASSFRSVLGQITWESLTSGSTFYTARRTRFPKVFEFQWIEAIRTGEVSGKMALVLTELNKQIRDARETRRKVKGASCIL